MSIFTLDSEELQKIYEKIGFPWESVKINFKTGEIKLKGRKRK